MLAPMEMNKREFTNQHRETAKTLEPLKHLVARGTLAWNGINYAKSEETKPEP
jgi:hypothetical protein